MDCKMEFINELLKKEVSIKYLCEQFGISEKTGHKWKNRFFEYGLIGLEDMSRKPTNSPNKLDEDTICYLINLRSAHPKWGPKKIKQLFVETYPNKDAPSLSSIFRVLDKVHLIKKQRIKKAVTDKDNVFRNRIQPKEPNDVWTIDFKGHWFSDGEKCLPLTIRDLLTKQILDITLCPNETYEVVRAIFEKVFKKYGLPKVIRSDNGTPFASKSAPLGLSKLSVWFLSLGIMVDRITPGKPGQNGSHERMHRDLSQDIEKHIPGGVKENQIAINEWVNEYNTVRPNEAIGMKKPSELYVKSTRKYEEFDTIEYPIGFLSRKVNSKGALKLNQYRYNITSTLGGYQVGLQELDNGEYKIWIGNYPLFILQTETATLKLPKHDKLVKVEDLPMS